MKNLLETGIGFLILLSAILVLGLGYLVYNRITLIVETVSEDSKPDPTLMLLQDLGAQLEKAEGSVRLYSYSKNSADLRGYKNSIDRINTILDSLVSLDTTGSRFAGVLDTVAGLIGDKADIWQQMIALNSRDVADQYLDTIARTLEEKVKADSARENRGFFRKIFKRNKKPELNEEELISNLEQFRRSDATMAQRLAREEKKLSEAGAELSQKLFGLIARIERDARRARAEKTENARMLARETFRWVTWFSAGSALLSLLVIFLIVRYISKSRKTTRMLRKASDESLKLSKAREIFIANVSHEVRTPINIINGFIHQLLKKDLPESIRGDLDVIRTSSDHLVQIVNDVLDFSKLAADRMKLEPVDFDPRKAAEDIYRLFYHEAVGKNVALFYQVHSDVPPVLRGDLLRLKQVLINLVSNAIKFSEGGRVEFNLRWKEAEGESRPELIGEVSDTGVGMESEVAGRIFDPFTQADGSVARKYGGTGLGLSIVKKIVDLHGGTIEVDSAPGKGTRFLFSMPYQTGNRIEGNLNASDAVPLPEEIRNLKILIVDDEPFNLKVICRMLSDWNLTCTTATSGFEALEHLKNRFFDLVLLDFRMPEMDGLEVARYIRDKLKIDKDATRIVLVTAGLPPGWGNNRPPQIDTVLSKPFSEASLLNILKDIAGQKPAEIPQQQQNNEVKTTSGINLSELKRLAGNDNDFARELLERLLVSFPESADRMKEALKNDNLEALSDIAHRMASPARHIGAGKLLELLKKIEALPGSEPQEDLPEQLCEQCFVEIERVCNAISVAVREEL
ncbi:MAG: hypothetical protein Kow00127_14720 [Bacteroidales bacterium]